jgi:AAHS family 4-hydroxybenzoate transporter-like MFS transporter
MSSMPESIAFMVVRDYPAERIRACLRQIAGHDSQSLARIAAAQASCTTDVVAPNERSPLEVIFAPNYLFGTLMLWTSYFMGLLLYYSLTNWMPTLFRETGFSVSRAALVTALFPLGGGVGALICGWLMGRLKPFLVVSGAYFLTTILMMILARATGNASCLMCMTFLAGLAMNGAQTSMPVLAAASYPTSGRASGVAWMLGIGRIGGIAGAFGGGLLLRAGYSIAEIISGLSVVALAASLALFCKDWLNPDSRQA